jgi:cell division protein FtsL
MARKQRPKIRLRFRHGSPLLKIALIITLVLCTVSLLTLHNAITRTEAETALLCQQAARLERENHDLAKNIAEIGTVQGIKRIASQMLDLVEGGASFFTPGVTNP